VALVFVAAIVFLTWAMLAAQRAGATLPAPEQALSYWNRPVGLAVLAAIFATSLVIAGGAAWSLWQGIVQVRPRSGEMAAILIMLPVGAGWLFLRVLKRRRAVLAVRGR
jgi:hypothetical protein